MKKPLCVAYFLLSMLCVIPADAQSHLDIQGHRGCRGLMPENSMPAFLKAVELGATTLEMDVVISGDGEVVVSHEPYMSGIICSHPDGKPVSKKEEKSLNIYQMPYPIIQTYDCGMRLHEGFPNQHKVNVVKPTLKMVVRSVLRFASENQYSAPAFNIELKSDPKGYGVYFPKPDVFAGFVINEIRRLGIEDQTTLQSFDVNILEELYKASSRKFKIAFLVESGKKINKNLERLSFVPDIYSPLYTLLTSQDVKLLHEKGISVIPWTINSVEEADTLIGWGVDGIITDYPDFFIGKSRSIHK
ncbi:MAG: glycerophosphodiester phosphodiesterase [Bacteroidota bacterium]|nr:glycerophosphodiester phosphodiesterase [Bacteroidota bacterium]